MLLLHHRTAIHALCAMCFSVVCITGYADATAYSHTFYGKTYRISYGDNKLDADYARDNCKLHGGYLVDIRSTEEVEHLVAIIGEHHPSDTQSKFIIGTRGHGNWKYANSDRTIYTNWAPGMPINGEDCVYMSGINGMWGNVDCDAEHNYICTKIPASPKFWYPFYGKNYYIPITGEGAVKGIDAARTKCIALGGTLADIHSEEELQHVKTIIYSTGYDKRIWHWWFAIGGRRINETWKHEDGVPMTFTKWASGQPGSGDCVHLGSQKANAITLPGTNIYLSRECYDVTNIHYVCSSTSDMFVDIPNEFMESSVATWMCVSYVPTATTGDIEFIVRTTENNTVQILATNSVSITRKFMNLTQVDEVRLSYEYIPRREHNDLSVECQAHVGTRIIVSAKSRMTIYFPPNNISISGVKDIFENQQTSINIFTDESYPVSIIHIVFIESQRMTIVSENRTTTAIYTGYVRNTVCTFIPLRRDNGRFLHVRLKNNRFPDLNITQEIPVVVYFPPTRIHVSIEPLLIEGQLETINITSDESFPHSNIDIDFNPRQTPPITKFFHDNISKNYTSYMLRAEYGFHVSREDNGKLFQVVLKNAKFSTLNLTQARSLVVHFASLGTNLVFNSSWYREGQIIMATCDDGGAFPNSDIEFYNVENITILNDTTSQQQTAGISYFSTSTLRTIIFSAATILSDKRIGCVATHPNMDIVRKAHTTIPIYYMHDPRIVNFVLDHPGSLNVSIKAFPRELFYEIIDSLNRTLASGDAVVDQHNNVSVSGFNQFGGGHYTLVVRNNYGMSVRIGLTYIHVPETAAASSQKAALVPIIGSICGILFLVVCVFVVGTLLAKKREKMCFRAKTGLPNVIGLHDNIPTANTCSTDDIAIANSVAAIACSIDVVLPDSLPESCDDIDGDFTDCDDFSIETTSEVIQYFPNSPPEEFVNPDGLLDTGPYRLVSAENIGEPRPLHLAADTVVSNIS